MNYKTAIEYMEFIEFSDENGCIYQKKQNYTEKLKKQYKKLALKYHPDKNSSPDATFHFQKIVEAYNHLLKQEHLSFYYDESESESDDEMSHQTEDEIPGTFDSFQSNIFQRTRKEWVLKIIEPFFEKEHLEKPLVDTIDVILDFLQKKLEHYIKNKTQKNDETLKKQNDETLKKQNDETLKKQNDEIDKNTNKEHATILQKELHPSVDDLFENNLYRITHENKDYIIPLWHHELTYDVNDSLGNIQEMVVKCIPILPANINIDCDNNLHVKIKKNIRELWNVKSSVVFFSIGKYVFEYPKKNIRFVKYQTLKLLKKGISKIDSIDIFDITKKANIYIELELWLDEYC